MDDAVAPSFTYRLLVELLVITALILEVLLAFKVREVVEPDMQVTDAVVPFMIDILPDTDGRAATDTVGRDPIFKLLPTLTVGKADTDTVGNPDTDMTFPTETVGRLLIPTVPVTLGSADILTVGRPVTDTVGSEDTPTLLPILTVGRPETETTLPTDMVGNAEIETVGNPNTVTVAMPAPPDVLDCLSQPDPFHT